MAKTKIVQNSFVSGVLNDKAYGRTDIQKFYNSVGEAHNMLIAVTGGIYKRPGFQYLDITDIPNDTEIRYARTIDFVFNTNQKYIFLIYYDADLGNDGANAGGVIDIYEVPARGSGFSPMGAPFQSLDGLTELTPDIIKDLCVIKRGDISLLFHGSLEPRFILRGEDGTFTYGIKGIIPPLEDPEITDSEQWSDELGWPQYACFFQGRLFCAGNYEFPLSIWGSKSQSYFDFQIAVADATEPDAPINDTIDSDNINHITGIYPGRNLQIFTTGAEFINNSKLITPLDSAWQIQTQFGTSPSVPIIAADGSVFYVDRQSAVREFVYDFEQDGYISTDITTLASQLFYNPFRLEHIKSAKNNLGRYIYCLNEDGRLAVLNFDKSESVIAWSMIEMSGSRTIVDISTVDNELYVLVQDGNNYYLERLDLADTITYQDNFTYYIGDVPLSYCDIADEPLDDHPCTETVGGLYGIDFALDSIWCKNCQMFTDPLTPPITAINDLERFNDRYVALMLDGIYQGDFLIENGTLPIERPFTIAQIGYKYSASVVSLPLASPQFQAELSEKRIIFMKMYMYKTSGFWINDEFINSSFYDVAGFSRRADDYTGVYSHYQLGWDTLQTYKVSSVDPTPFAILKNEIHVDIGG